MAKSKIDSLISKWMDEFGAANGYELFKTEFVKEGPTWYLRVYVDRLIDGKYDYMTSDDCEKVSRFLSAKLDEDDPIKQNYYLEVSSPGLDRELSTEKDFKRFLGEQIEIKLYEPIDGSKMLTGKLIDYTKDSITIEDKEEIKLPLNKAAKINLAVVF